MAPKKRPVDSGTKVKSLKPKAARVKGGSRVMASAHEMKKSLISNFPR